MNTFDAWETGIHLNPDVLMHWGVRGMKHGRRRYQNEDGTWTEEGLAARRKREGFGEDRQVRKLEKKVAKAEKKQAKKAARAEKKFEKAEKKRKSKLSGLTDEEMKAKLERAKMEAEYRDLTKRHTITETGANLIGKFLDYKTTKDKQALEANRQKLEMARLKTQQIQAQESTTQAKYQKAISRHKAKEAKQERKKTEADVKGGLKILRKKELEQAKLNYRNSTIRGAIGNFLNSRAKGVGEASGDYKLNKKHAKGLVKAQSIVDDYNKNRPKGSAKLYREETAWQRQQTEARERRANAEAIAKLNAEKEKWKSRGKR